MKVKKIGIECENLEGERFGVGHTMAQLLNEITQTPGVQKKYKFVLIDNANADSRCIPVSQDFFHV